MQPILVAEDATDDGVNDDAVAEIIELVDHNGGEVVFVPREQMNEKEPIALMTRYYSMTDWLSLPNCLKIPM